MSDPVSSTAASQRVGVIYFIRRGNEMRYVKIGWSMWPKQRLKELQTGSPDILSIIATEEGKTKKDELALHRRFKEYRRWGEWFNVKGTLAEYLIALKCWYPAPPGSKPRCPRYYERLKAADKTFGTE